MIVYVQRNAGVIIGVCRALQPGIAEEAIDDQVAEVQTYLNAPGVEAARRATLVATHTANAKAAVNGTAVGALTANQLRLILLIVCAERGWIDNAGKIAIP